MKNVMVKAWEIAKVAVVKFGGSAVEYFALSLKQAWAEIKKGAEKMENTYKTLAEYKKAKIAQRDALASTAVQLKGKSDKQIKYAQDLRNFIINFDYSNGEGIDKYIDIMSKFDSEKFEKVIASGEISEFDLMTMNLKRFNLDKLWVALNVEDAGQVIKYLKY